MCTTSIAQSSQAQLTRLLAKAESKPLALYPPSERMKERFNHLVRERLDDRPPGYPRLAALVNSDSGFVMYRRFGYIHNRILLHHQAELVELERKLDKLDADDDANPDRKFRLQTREFYDGDDEEQKLLIEDLEKKLKSYGKGIDRKSNLSES